MNNISKKEARFQAIYPFVIAAILIVVAIIGKSFMTFVISLCSLIGGAMNMRGSRLFCIPYAVYAVLYTYYAFITKNYGEMVFTAVYLFPLYILGTIDLVRKKNKKSVDGGIEGAGDVSRRAILLMFFGAAAVTVGYGFILRYFNSAAPFLNGGATALCALGTFLAYKRVRQQWFFWMAYDFIMIALWTSASFSDLSGIPLAVQFAGYLGLDVFGMKNWYRGRKMNKNHLN